MDANPNPLSKPERVGTIQWISFLYPDQPNQNKPAANETPPAITLGRRHSGIGTPLLAANFLWYQGCCIKTVTPAITWPIIIPKKVSPATPGDMPWTPWKTKGYAVRKRYSSP